jgi:hypothetical protein
LKPVPFANISWNGLFFSLRVKKVKRNKGLERWKGEKGERVGKVEKVGREKGLERLEGV